MGMLIAKPKLIEVLKKDIIFCWFYAEQDTKVEPLLKIDSLISHLPAALLWMEIASFLEWTVINLWISSMYLHIKGSIEKSLNSNGVMIHSG